ncbi:MFS transporter [Amycolatopsis anabasis]|uniref:MFS transporter n=1 Tax=Amycolatopsis anabasis TaxID=1840409 RepID=UPI00131AEDD2|nr:MFS transporter [Amycolatopsis anabasis]
MLAVLCASLLLVGMDLTVLHVAVPTLTRRLLPGPTELLWIVDAYSLTVAALLVTAGTLGDRIGRKRVLLAGFAVFGLASAAAALCTAPVPLIAARVALGAGAAMIMAATVSVIRTVFPDDRERALAIGLWTASHSVGASLGPVVGGLLLERFWWGSVFLVNVPIVALALVFGARLVPNSRNPAPRRWDLGSAALSIAGLAAAVFALKRFGEHGSVDLGAAAGAAIGAALLCWFVARQRRSRTPLLDLSLFGDRRFAMATVSVLGCFGCYTALLFLLAQRFQLVDGDSPLGAGRTLLPMAVANAIGAVVAPRLAVWWGRRWIVFAGLALFAVTLAGYAVTGTPAVLAGAGLGAGFVMTLGADAIMAAARPERAGEASAIQETSFELGAGLGVAVLGTVAFGPGFLAAVWTATGLLAVLSVLSAVLLRDQRTAASASGNVKAPA